MNMPDDSPRILEFLVKESKEVVQYAPLMNRLLLRGAIIDAEDLLAEINGCPRKDTRTEALNVLRNEARKVQP
jgi:hypothetical protein